MTQWLLRSGIHSDNDAVPIQLVANPRNGEERKLSDWEGLKPDIVPPNFFPGDIFESDKDLSKLNCAGSEKRFEKLSEIPHVVQDELEGKTKAQLLEFAEAEEITLTEGLNKPEIVAAIRGFLMYQKANAKE